MELKLLNRIRARSQQRDHLRAAEYPRVYKQIGKRSAGYGFRDGRLIPMTDQSKMAEWLPIMSVNGGSIRIPTSLSLVASRIN
jgi:hypothetical protein